MEYTFLGSDHFVSAFRSHPSKACKYMILSILQSFFCLSVVKSHKILTMIKV